MNTFVVGSCMAVLALCILYWEWRDRLDNDLPQRPMGERRLSRR